MGRGEGVQRRAADEKATKTVVVEARLCASLSSWPINTVKSEALFHTCTLCRCIRLYSSTLTPTVGKKEGLENNTARALEGFQEASRSSDRERG